MKQTNFYLFLMLFMSATIMPATMLAKPIKQKLMRGIILEYDSLPGRATLTSGKTFVMTGHFDDRHKTTVPDCKLTAKGFSRIINGTPQEGLTFEGEVAFEEHERCIEIKLISGKLKLGNYELSDIKDTYFTLSHSEWSLYNLHNDIEWWESVSSPIDEKFWNCYKYESDYHKKRLIYEQLKGGSPKQASLFKHTRFYTDEEIHDYQIRYGYDYKKKLQIKPSKLRIDYDNGAYIVYSLYEPSYSETLQVSRIEYISLPNGDYCEDKLTKENGKITFSDAIVVPADTNTIDVPYNYYDGDRVQVKNLYNANLICIANSDGSKYIGNIDATIDNNPRRQARFFDLAQAVFRSPKDLSIKDIVKYRDGVMLDKNGQQVDTYLDCQNKSERYAWHAKVVADNKKAGDEARAAKAKREREEAAVWQKLANKYGSTWTNMAKQGRVAVGMPEEVLKNIPNVNYWRNRADVYIRYYWVDNEYDLYYISNGKVSYISHLYDTPL